MLNLNVKELSIAQVDHRSFLGLTTTTLNIFSRLGLSSLFCILIKFLRRIVLESCDKTFGVNSEHSVSFLNELAEIVDVCEVVVVFKHETCQSLILFDHLLKMDRLLWVDNRPESFKQILVRLDKWLWCQFKVLYIVFLDKLLDRQWSKCFVLDFNPINHSIIVNLVVELVVIELGLSTSTIVSSLTSATATTMSTSTVTSWCIRPISIHWPSSAITLILLILVLLVSFSHLVRLLRTSDTKIFALPNSHRIQRFLRVVCDKIRFISFSMR